MNAIDFKSELASIKKGLVASLVTNTIVKLPKKYGISGVVTKYSEKVVRINASYENCVNARISRNGGNADFVAESLPWGTWAKGLENIVIENKGNDYLRYYVEKGSVKSTTYYVDGVKATDAEVAIIKAYEESKSGSAKQEAKGLADENQVKPCVVNFENIVFFKCGNIIYDTRTSLAV